MMDVFTSLEQEIYTDLEIELNKDDDFDGNILLVKIRSAIREVYELRGYENTNYSNEKIARDMYRHYSVILNVARYDYNQIGAEGQVNHSENDISRTWVSRDSLLGRVVRICSHAK